MADPKLQIERRVERCEKAIGTMAAWLVQAQTGFGAKDAEGIEKILRGEDGSDMTERPETPDPEPPETPEAPEAPETEPEPEPPPEDGPDLDPAGADDDELENEPVHTDDQVPTDPPGAA
jgi:hypothetical protein